MIIKKFSGIHRNTFNQPCLRRSLFLLAFMFAGYTAICQPIRINFMAGMANYYGELQPKQATFNQAKTALGLGVTFDVTNKILVRGEFMFAKLGADDKKNDKASYRVRNLNFQTNVQELSLMGEYNVWDLYEKKITPYFFAGIGLFKYDPYTFDSANKKVYLRHLSTEGQGLAQYPDRKPYKNIQINVPMGAGLKYALSDDIQIGFENSIRVIFTDYLDDVSTTYVDQNVLLNSKGPVAVSLAYRGDELKPNPGNYPRDGGPRGSPKAKDLYYYGLARLSIKMNWFENGAGFGNRKNRMGCPARVL